MVAGNVYTALKHVVALAAMPNGTDLLHFVCDCGGIHHRKAKKKNVASCFTQRFRQWLRPQRASAIAEACLIGLVAHPQSCSKLERMAWGMSACVPPLRSLVRTTSSRTFFRFRWLTARAVAPEAAVAVFLTSRQPSQCQSTLPGASQA